MRKLLISILFAFSTFPIFAQGYWKLDYSTDDYTMEKNYVLCHYTSGSMDAAYFPNDSVLKVMRDYKGLPYFDACWDAAVENDGRISDSEQTIFTRLIFAKDYAEKVENVTISYRGSGDDGKIDTNGFYSAFYIYYAPEDLKKANFVTFKYFDKIIGDIRVLKLSLSGFTKCYSAIKK